MHGAFYRASKNGEVWMEAEPGTMAGRERPPLQITRSNPIRNESSFPPTRARAAEASLQPIAEGTV